MMRMMELAETSRWGNRADTHSYTLRPTSFEFA